MVEVIKSSFIPKKEIRKVSEKKGSGISVFFLISLVVFLSSIVGGTGMYFWKSSLETQNNLKQKKLEKDSENYGIAAFKKFINIDKKIKVGEKMLANHYSVSPIYTFLNKYTIKDIVFTKMSLVEDGEYISVELSGKASESGDLVRQKDLYTGTGEYEVGGVKKRGNPNIEDFVFSNITRSKESNEILFNMSFKVNKKWLTTNKLIEE